MAIELFSLFGHREKLFESFQYKWKSSSIQLRNVQERKQRSSDVSFYLQVWKNFEVVKSREMDVVVNQDKRSTLGGW